MGMRGPDRIIPNEALKQQFISLLEIGISVNRAAICSGYSRTVWFKLKDSDELFRIAWNKATADAGRYETLLAKIIYKRIVEEIGFGKNYWPAIKFAIANFKLGFVDPDVETKRHVNTDKVAIVAEYEAMRHAVKAGNVTPIQDAEKDDGLPEPKSILA